MGSDLYTHVENMEVEGRENQAYKDNDLSTGILEVKKHPKISIDFQQAITITLLIQSPIGSLNRWTIPCPFPPRPCRSQTSAVLDHTHLVASPTAWFRAAQGRSHHNLKNGHSTNERHHRKLKGTPIIANHSPRNRAFIKGGSESSSHEVR